MTDGETGPQPGRLGEQDVPPYAGGLQPKNDELSVQGSRRMMAKADRSGRQNKAERWFLRRAGIVGRAEG